MTRIAPLSLEELPKETRKSLEYAQSIMGFTANDVLTMARWPALLQAMQPMVAVIYGPGRLDDGLKRLIALVTSTASGCRYCQAHTAHGAAAVQVDPAKIDAVWEFETSELFSEAERAALRIARDGATQNINDTDFASLKEHFDDREIMEIVAVISLFGFLNRWNAALNTEIEAEPAEHLQRLEGAAK